MALVVAAARWWAPKAFKQFRAAALFFRVHRLAGAAVPRLCAHASRLRTPVHAATDGFGQALYVAGAYLLTVGTTEVQPHGFMRALLLFSALSGFGVITATITFILEIQSNLHERETGVLKLNGLIGKPPSGIGLLETLAALNLKRDLTALLREWADWSASVMNSHVSFPVLVYFHSVGSDSDWVNALQFMLDAATLVMELTDEESAGAAAYMHRAGSRTAAHLCDCSTSNPSSRKSWTSKCLWPWSIDLGVPAMPFAR